MDSPDISEADDQTLLGDEEVKVEDVRASIPADQLANLDKMSRPDPRAIAKDTSDNAGEFPKPQVKELVGSGSR